MGMTAHGYKIFSGAMNTSCGSGLHYLVNIFRILRNCMILSGELYGM